MILIEKILEEISSLPKWDTQIALQGVTYDQDPFEPCGLLRNLKHPEDQHDVPLFELPYTNSIMELHGLFRTRVLKVKPYSCYTYHKDRTKRFHIPLITNDRCFLILNDEVIRMPADGDFYIVDTTQWHTFVNASEDDRIHIVGNIPED